MAISFSYAAVKKSVAMGATVISVATSTVIVAGGILLAIGGSSMALAVGAGAAAIGAARAYSRLRSKYTEKKPPKHSIIKKIVMNPILKMVTSTVIFYAGLGLALSTALSGVGGTLPLAFGYLMMVSGGLGALAGGVAAIAGGIKLAVKVFSRKKNQSALPVPAVKPVATEPKAAPSVTDQSAKPAFDAAAKGNDPAAKKETPAAKPAAPKAANQ